MAWWRKGERKEQEMVREGCGKQVYVCVCMQVDGWLGRVNERNGRRKHGWIKDGISNNLSDCQIINWPSPTPDLGDTWNYFNVLYVGLPLKTSSKLQLIQNGNVEIMDATRDSVCDTSFLWTVSVCSWLPCAIQGVDCHLIPRHLGWYHCSHTRSS